MHPIDKTLMLLAPYRDKVRAALDEENPEKRALLWKEAHESQMKFGMVQGWWIEYDEKGPFRIIEIPLVNLPTQALTAHALVETKMFNSVSEARRNGFTEKCIVGQIIKLKRRRTTIVIK